MHPSADVAIAPCVLDLATHVFAQVPEVQFADKWSDTADSRLALGDTVYFMGLLANVPSMGDRAVPMMRSGTVGAWYQEQVPFRNEVTGHTNEEPFTHLIDCRSVGGFSGSPVFITQLGVGHNPYGRLALGFGKVALLGLIIGHFEGQASGVAAVVPVEAIRELLSESEKLVEDRRLKDAAFRQQRGQQRDANAGIKDSASRESEFERFADLTSMLVNVPKKEIDEKRKADES